MSQISVSGNLRSLSSECCLPISGGVTRDAI